MVAPVTLTEGTRTMMEGIRTMVTTLTPTILITEIGTKPLLKVRA